MTELRRAIQTALNYGKPPINEGISDGTATWDTDADHMIHDRTDMINFMDHNLNTGGGEHHYNKMMHHIDMHNALNKARTDFPEDSHVANELSVNADYHLNQAKHHHELSGTVKPFNENNSDDYKSEVIKPRNKDPEDKAIVSESPLNFGISDKFTTKEKKVVKNGAVLDNSKKPSLQSRIKAITDDEKNIIRDKLTNHKDVVVETLEEVISRVLNNYKPSHLHEDIKPIEPTTSTKSEIELKAELEKKVEDEIDQAFNRRAYRNKSHTKANIEDTEKRDNSSQ